MPYDGRRTLIWSIRNPTILRRSRAEIELNNMSGLNREGTYEVHASDKKRDYKECPYDNSTSGSYTVSKNLFDPVKILILILREKRNVRLPLVVRWDLQLRTVNRFPYGKQGQCSRLGPDKFSGVNGTAKGNPLTPTEKTAQSDRTHDCKRDRFWRISSLFADVDARIKPP